MGGNEECVKVLLQHKADVETKDENGLTPLHIAAGYGNAKCVKTFLKKGAKVDIREKNGYTALCGLFWKDRMHSYFA